MNEHGVNKNCIARSFRNDFNSLCFMMDLNMICCSKQPIPLNINPIQNHLIASNY